MPRQTLLHWLSDEEASSVSTELTFVVLAVVLVAWILGAAVRLLRRSRR